LPGVGARAAVMNDLPAHKITGVRKTVEAAGPYLLYLPPYSPDFNSIDIAFSRLMARLGKRAAASTVNDLWGAIAQAIGALTPHERPSPLCI